MLNDSSFHSVGRPRALASLRVVQGFNLVELLVTLSIASILMALAAPSFSSLMANQRLKGAASDIHMALIRARSEALTRNVSVALFKNGVYWQDGWKIVVPTNANTKIDDHGAVKNVTIDGPSDVTYRPTGRITSDAEAVFSIKANNTDKQWCISVDLSGRPYQKSVSADSTC